MFVLMITTAAFPVFFEFATMAEAINAMESLKTADNVVGIRMKYRDGGKWFTHMDWTKA